MSVPAEDSRPFRSRRLGGKPVSVTEQSDLQEIAARHLWMNFSPIGRHNASTQTPVMVRAEGCYVWDESGKRYLDALSSLFCVNIGHGRADVAAAAAEQGAILEYYP